MFVEEVQVTVKWEWHEIGEVTLQQSGRFSYPRGIAGGGVYRIRLNEGEEQVHVYVGESSDLERRIPEDIRRLATQSDVRGLLERGGNVRLDRAERVSVTLEDVSGRSAGPVELDSKYKRLAVEGIALAVEAPNVGILNLHRTID